MKIEEAKPWASLDWPNRITMLRLLLVWPFVVLLRNLWQWGEPARYGAVGILVVMGVSDYLDGVLARRLNARSRLGAILDPLADKVLIICAVVVLSLPGSAVPGAQVPDYVVVAVVGKDLWVIVGFLVVYLVTDRFRVYPTSIGKACTFGQLLMVGFVLISPDLNRLADGVGSWVARGMCWAVAAISVLAVISYTRLGLGFIVTEEKPLEDNNTDRPASDGSD